MHINEREKLGIKKLKTPKSLIDYLQTTDHVYEDLEGCKPTKKIKLFLVFDATIWKLIRN